MDRETLHRIYSTRIHVRFVRIRGNKRTRASIIEQQLRVAYDAGDMNELRIALNAAQNNLKRLGIFKSLNITVDKSQSNRMSGEGEEAFGKKPIDLIVECEERDVCSMKAGAYAQGKSASMEMSTTFKNAMGLAETVSTRFGISSNASNTFHTSLTTPRPFGANGDVGVSLIHDAESFAESSSYSQGTSGGSIWFRTNRSRSPFVHEFKYSGLWREIVPVLGGRSAERCLASARVARAAVDQSFKSSISHAVRYDTRNQKLMPTKGLFATFRNELAGFGGDATFLKSWTSMEWLRPLPGWLGRRAGLVLQVNAEAGVLCPLGSDAQLARDQLGTRIIDRFFLGGPRSFPGFDHRGAGGERGVRASPPRPQREDEDELGDELGDESGESNGERNKETRGAVSSRTDGLGGDIMGVSSVSLHMPVPGTTMRALGVRVGVHGTLGQLLCWRSQKACESSADIFRRFCSSPRASYGVGVMLPTPFGKVSLTWSKPFRSHCDDAVSRWQVGFGNAA